MILRFRPGCVDNRLIVPTIWKISYSMLGNLDTKSCLVSRKFVDLNYWSCLRFCSNGIRSNEEDDDFFGIKYFSADDIKGVDGLNQEQKQKINEKINSIKELESLKSSEEGFERLTTFGKVRYDRENKVDYMGQFENDSKHILIEKRRRYLLEISLGKEVEKESTKETTSSDQQKDDSNLIEEQYFNSLHETSKAESENTPSSVSKDDLNYIDYQYFKEVYSPEVNDEGLPVGPVKFHFTPQWDEYRSSLDSFETDKIVDYRRSPEALLKDLDKFNFSGDSPLRSVEEVAHELMLLRESKPTHEEVVEVEDEQQGIELEQSNQTLVNFEDSKKVFDEIPKTALEYVTKMRQGQLQPEDKAYLSHLESKFRKIGSEFKMRSTKKIQETYDSSGKRNFLEQTPRLNQLRRDELVDFLSNQILFNERDLIAINKPNGLIVEGAGENSKYPSLEAILPYLSRVLFPRTNDKLYIVHRLDRDATGVLLLARSLFMVKTLRDLFAERKISKYYWAIVRGVPDPSLGIIDIPIESGKINGVERMYLRPECDNDFNRSMGTTRGAFPAITHYRILRACGNASMIELKPEQGIKHQIRVHLGFGLRTPILGDHKYSYLDKVAPQKLPDDMLKRLNIRQTKVRNIPLHLHAKLYIIPGVGINGGNISIPAKLPDFFRKNMSSLGLYARESVIKNPIAF